MDECNRCSVDRPEEIELADVQTVNHSRFGSPDYDGLSILDKVLCFGGLHRWSRRSRIATMRLGGRELSMISIDYRRCGRCKLLEIQGGDIADFAEWFVGDG